ncbi:branched-chain amino acid ABC transporter permease [Mobilitalea sibirica]|uniref:Branched-chain amino acid ABC transporter permease n=1 Tax=Mobilitalea sibirica TaxID=1462919 RepID=A0A8J7H484_9FIRM|nr:branched-chain amino acid ABC transporter permease [Mobilitalea sibirica]MBH1942178.1 branched-chain amino acid ABC transporter permease [Mobilitalea sibirica]
MILQQIFNGLSLGMAYALIAVGYSLVFGILRLVNFSHGAVYAFGAHAVIFFIGYHFGLIPAILLGVLLTGALGVLIDRVALYPLRKKKSPGISSLITTIGISYIIQNLLMMGFGSEKKPFPKLFDNRIVHILGARISTMQIIMFVTSVILLAILTFLIKGTKIGLAMRAVEQNEKNAGLMGINTNFIIAFTFFLGGISAAIASVLISGYYEILYPTMGFMVGLKAFAAAVLGGIGVLHGAIVGGLVIGVSEGLAATWFGSQYRDSVAFIILIIVLIVRPAGLFGRKGIEKV